MTYLIDGYNLLYAVGWAPKRPNKLEPARRKLLDWLAESVPLKSGAAVFRVVFDAQKGRAPNGGRSHRGVLVQFAYRRTADDLIEVLLAAKPTPGTITVVSNDGRLHEAARRTGSRGWTCQAFLDWLIEAERGTPGTAHYRPPEKPDGPASADETAALLRAFGKPKPR
ncbi:MAG TPA: NYN domain-containing protein [Fimbriiglobus sp.]|nr:NYN domain-containing protein [Fimbriiglobus sp.]